MITQNKTSQGGMVCEATKELERMLDWLEKCRFTGTYILEINFHDGDISKKIKRGTVETIRLPKQ